MNRPTRNTLFGCVLCLIIVSAVRDASAIPSSDSSYFCVAEVSGGIAFDNDLKTWKPAGFRTGNKFILKLRFLSQSNEKNYSGETEVRRKFAVFITESGKNNARECYRREDFRNPVSTVDDWIECRASLDDYRFNFKSNRFLDIYPYGYADGADNKENTPSVTAGTCTKID